MKEAAEPVTADDMRRRGGRRRSRDGLWRLERECPVWPRGVVMVDVGPEHVLEVAAAEDQQPVEAVAADGADEALGIGVGLRSPKGGCG